MQIFKRKIGVLGVGILGMWMTGCAPGCYTHHDVILTQNYVAPKIVETAPQNALPASVVGYSRFGGKELGFAISSQKTYIAEVDGATVSVSRSSDPSAQSIQIIPGQHNLTLKTQIVLSDPSGELMSGNNYSAMSALQVILKPGIHYTLNGVVQNGYVMNWLQDASGRRVSTIARAAYHVGGEE